MTRNLPPLLPTTLLPTTLLMGASGPKRRRDGAAGRPPAAGPRPAGPSPAGGGGGGGAPLTRAFAIRSEFAASRDVQTRIMDDVVACGFDEESVFAIRIALEEAIVNAIRHGNRLDAAKTVRVESAVSPARVEISVEDEGTGFDRHHIPDPTREENLCRPNGRGILLIESYMDAVTWEQGGRRVRMVKDPAPVAPAGKA